MGQKSKMTKWYIFFEIISIIGLIILLFASEFWLPIIFIFLFSIYDLYKNIKLYKFEKETDLQYEKIMKEINERN